MFFFSTYAAYIKPDCLGYKRIKSSDNSGNIPVIQPWQWISLDRLSLVTLCSSSQTVSHVKGHRTFMLISLQFCLTAGWQQSSCDNCRNTRERTDTFFLSSLPWVYNLFLWVSHQTKSSPASPDLLEGWWCRVYLYRIWTDSKTQISQRMNDWFSWF